MKKPVRLLALILSALSIALTSCGGGGGGGLASGGIGGTGITSSSNSIGRVTATGSITVNDVRFETTTATVTDDDGSALSEADLKVGLIVEVDGEVNEDKISGDAAQVTVITVVKGPVEQIAQAAGSLTVLGQPVAIDDQTVFDDSIQPNDLSGLSVGQDVEISGTVDPSGTIRATRIEPEAAIAVFKVRGFINTATATTLTINGLTVDISGAALQDFDGSAPAVNDFVTVKGGSLAGSVLTADTVENEARSFDDDANAEIEGFIIAATSPSFSLVSGAGTFDFRTDDATEFEGGTLADLIIGVKVEVEGVFSAGIMVADKVSIKDGIRLRATTGTVDTVNRTIVALNLSAIELRLNDQTDVTDDRSAAINETPSVDDLLPTLSTGAETLRIRARVSDDSPAAPGATQLIVTELRVRDLEDTVNDIQLRGPLEAPPGTGGELVILGVAISSTNTIAFLDENDQVITRTEFLNQVTTGTSVEAEGVFSGDNAIDAVDQLEIED